MPIYNILINNNTYWDHGVKSFFPDWGVSLETIRYNCF